MCPTYAASQPPKTVINHEQVRVEEGVKPDDGEIYASDFMSRLKVSIVERVEECFFHHHIYTAHLLMS